MEQNTIFQVWKKIKGEFSYGEIHHFMILLKNKKPHITIQSFLFLENDHKNRQNETSNDEKQKIIYLKGYNEIKKQDICVKVYFMERFKNTHIFSALERIVESCQRLQRKDLIVQIYDSYYLQIENNINIYYIIEQEVILDQDLLQLLNNSQIYEEDKLFIHGIIKSAIYYYSSKMINSQLIQHSISDFQFQVVQNGDKLQIKLNSLYIEQNPSENQYLPFYQDTEQVDETPLEELQENQINVLSAYVSDQYQYVSRNNNILPQDLIQTINDIVPELITNQGVEIFEKIASYQQYESFQLDEYGQDYFTLKVFIKDEAFVMKVEKFMEKLKAEEVFERYRKYYSLPNQMFVPLISKELIHYHDGSFIAIVEKEIISNMQVDEEYNDNNSIEYDMQNLCNLLPPYLTLKNFISLDKFQNEIDSNIQNTFLIIQIMKHLDTIVSNGLKINSISDEQIFIQSSIKNNLDSCKILFSNILFPSTQLKDNQCSSHESKSQKLQEIFTYLLKNNKVYANENDLFALRKFIMKYIEKLISFEKSNLQICLEDFPYLKKQMVRLEELIDVYKNASQQISQFSEIHINKYGITSDFDSSISDTLQIKFFKLNIQEIVCSSSDLKAMLIMLKNEQIQIDSLVIKQPIYNNLYKIIDDKEQDDYEVSKIFPKLRSLTIQLQQSDLFKISQQFKQLLLLEQLDSISISLPKANYLFYTEEINSLDHLLRLAEITYDILKSNKQFRTINFSLFYVDMLLSFNKLKIYDQIIMNSKRQKLNIINKEIFNIVPTNITDFINIKICDTDKRFQQMIKLFFSQNQFNQREQYFESEIQLLQKEYQQIQIQALIKNKEEICFEFNIIDYPQFGVFYYKIRYDRENNVFKQEFEDHALESQLHCGEKYQLYQVNRIYYLISKAMQFRQMQIFIGNDTPYYCEHNQSNYFQLSMYKGQKFLLEMTLSIQICDCVNRLLLSNKNYFGINDQSHPSLYHLSIKILNRTFIQLLPIINDICYTYNSSSKLVSLSIYGIHDYSVYRQMLRKIMKIKRLVILNTSTDFQDNFE